MILSMYGDVKDGVAREGGHWIALCRLHGPSKNSLNFWDNGQSYSNIIWVNLRKRTVKDQSHLNSRDKQIYFYYSRNVIKLCQLISVTIYLYTSDIWHHNSDAYRHHVSKVKIYEKQDKDESQLIVLIKDGIEFIGIACMHALMHSINFERI